MKGQVVQKNMHGRESKAVPFVQKKVQAKKIAALSVLKYAAIFGMMLSLSLASLYDTRPFATGFFIALVFLKVPYSFLVPFYLVGEFLGGGLFGLFAALIVAAFVGGTKMLLVKSTKNLFWLLYIVAFLSGLAPAVFWAFQDFGLAHYILHATVLPIFAAACHHAMRPVFLEKLRYQMVVSESICLGVVTVAVAIGLSVVPLFGFPLVALAAVLMIYIAAKVASVGKAVMVGLVFGIGHAMVTLDIFAIAGFALIALIAGAFATAPKIIMPFAGVFAYLLFRFFFFFDLYGALLWTIAVAGAGLIYFCIPSKVYGSIKARLFEVHARLAGRVMLNQNRADLAKKLNGSADVFGQMAESLREYSNPIPDYSGALKSRCCLLCDYYTACSRDAEALDGALVAMMDSVFEKGRASINDMPPLLNQNCHNFSTLIKTASQICEQRKEVCTKTQLERKSRAIVAAQMYGMTEVLTDLANGITTPVSTEMKQERVLIEELNYAAVAAVEALIAGGEIVLIVRLESFDRKIIEKTVSRVLRNNFVITAIDNTLLSGFCSLRLKARPRYDIVFGSVAKSKVEGEKSGDTHSFIKINNSKFMMALCDGVGSGEKAEKISSRAIGLIESFYRAGFDSELVLKSVNEFLSVGTDEEHFCALDICVIDLGTGEVEMIKLASPASYIKRRDTVLRIDGKGAPMGAFERLIPEIAKVQLEVGDQIVLVTDGVSDSFDGDRLSASVNSLRTTNPKILGEGIMESVLYNGNGSIDDDSTVLVARLIENL